MTLSPFDTRVVFLDIDGVLNSEAFFSEKAGDAKIVTVSGVDIDRRLVARVDRLCMDARADVVVSSTWRLFYKLPKMRDMLRTHGLTARVIGITPCIPGAARGHEIEAWLERHPVDGCVIVDDDAEMAHLAPWLVRTSFLTGITDADVERAMQVIAGPAPRNRRETGT